jgi:hypothetical protein
LFDTNNEIIENIDWVINVPNATPGAPTIKKKTLSGKTAYTLVPSIYTPSAIPKVSITAYKTGTLSPLWS